SDGLIDLTKDSDGNECLPPGLFTKLLREQILNSDAGDNGIWSLPERVYEALANAGYRYQQDDCSILALRKEPRLQEREIVHLIPANHLHVDDCVQEAVRELNACCHTESASVRLELLLSEFLTNIVKHGFKRDEQSEEIIVLHLICLPKTGLRITVWDRGSKWDFHQQEEPGTELSPDEKLEQLSDAHAVSGRGIPILQKLAPSIVVHRWSELNETIFKIPCLGK
ncbi:MAG TPA: hypothetical protein DDZ11_08180, partial [Lentisphaeria bacterium]|nr:hypothetical protein [Lentisphaeria bacterium]